MTTQESELQHPSFAQEKKLPGEAVQETMWELFKEISKLLNIPLREKSMKPGLQVFISTRIDYYSGYFGEYINAAKLLEELADQWGKAEAYKKLFTNDGRDTFPTNIRLSRVRKFVINEFIFLQMVLSGKMFSKEKKYRSLHRVVLPE